MEWISVDNDYPKRGQPVLTYGSHCDPIVAYRVAGVDGGRWIQYDGDVDWIGLSGITHWMPLPEPPEASDE